MVAGWGVSGIPDTRETSLGNGNSILKLKLARASSVVQLYNSCLTCRYTAHSAPSWGLHIKKFTVYRARVAVSCFGFKFFTKCLCPWHQGQSSLVLFCSLSKRLGRQQHFVHLQGQCEQSTSSYPPPALALASAVCASSAHRSTPSRRDPSFTTKC